MCSDIDSSLFIVADADGCGCDMTKVGGGANCRMNLCKQDGASECLTAFASVATCSSFGWTNYTVDMQAQWLEAIMSSCAQGPSWNGATECSGDNLKTLLTEFGTACTACDMSSASFNPAACSNSICNNAGCSTAYMGLTTCAGYLAPNDFQSNLVMAIIPFGQSCNVNLNESCSYRAVQGALNGLEQVCGCSNKLDCLNKATACEFTGQCQAVAVNLISTCAAAVPSLPADYQQIFTSATTALLNCNAPKCTKLNNVYTFSGPFQAPGVECCDGASGSHGKDGSCCLRNPKQTDDQQPDYYVDNTGAACCYDSTKGAACPHLTSGVSTVSVAVAVVASIVALLL